MRVTCSNCGKKKTQSPSNLRKHGRTPETYVCITCANKMRGNRNHGPHETLNKLKEYSKTYKQRHSGCFAGRD
ncbi:MAG TPA: hypothetical protein VMY59_01120 [Candidatus Thermoplasmatota archaeon]|nr:hypothetical protein [Candidatus Thermoplasmatota archaeon]